MPQQLHLVTMAAICSCFAEMFGGGGSGFSRNLKRTLGTGAIEMERGIGSDAPSARRVKYNLKRRGTKVAVQGSSASGPGVVIASLPLEQDAAYWEVHVVRAGQTPLAVGVSRAVSDPAVLEEGPLAWALRANTANVSEEGEEDEEGTVEVPSTEGGSGGSRVRLKDGDVVGVCFSQSTFPMLTFTVNGEQLAGPGASVERVRGLVYPALHLAEGSEARFQFHEDDWVHAPPSKKFPMIMEVQDMI